MALSNSSQGAIIISVFLLPIITYFLYMRVSKPNSAGPLPPPTEITNLFIYPIKSCHGISIPTAKLLPTGLDLGTSIPSPCTFLSSKQSIKEYKLAMLMTQDRQWMWVTGPDDSNPYQFLTIRNNARMTLIRLSYDSSTDTLTVTAPAPNSMDEKLQFSMPAHPAAAWLSANTTIVSAKIWSRITPAHCYSPSLTGTFNAFFGQDVRLVYKSPISDSPRPLGSNGAKEYLGRDASTCFPDLMPILVGCESSIEELNSRLEKAEGLNIDIVRFRPNIVVKGHKPWDEDRWKTLAITPSSSSSSSLRAITLDVTQRCARCRVPNVDPETAEENSKEPWDTLVKYRRVDEGIKFKPCFGMLCVPRGEGGRVDVGAMLEVREVTNGHRYVTG
jgi:uncharacterized protein YcbX